ncbi:MAG TPA: hypothetical protein VKE51_05270 [Vicinamibacterales bacterium]|nr:hypothetical protein [Vicinamibacterales bacterium]
MREQAAGRSPALPAGGDRRIALGVGGERLNRLAASLRSGAGPGVKQRRAATRARAENVDEMLSAQTAPSAKSGHL